MGHGCEPWTRLLITMLAIIISELTITQSQGSVQWWEQCKQQSHDKTETSRVGAQTASAWGQGVGCLGELLTCGPTTPATSTSSEAGLAQTPLSPIPGELWNPFQAPEAWRSFSFIHFLWACGCTPGSQLIPIIPNKCNPKRSSYPPEQGLAMRWVREQGSAWTSGWQTSLWVEISQRSWVSGLAQPCKRDEGGGGWEKARELRVPRLLWASVSPSIWW